MKSGAGSKETLFLPMITKNDDEHTILSQCPIKTSDIHDYATVTIFILPDRRGMVINGFKRSDKNRTYQFLNRTLRCITHSL